MKFCRTCSKYSRGKCHAGKRPWRRFQEDSCDKWEPNADTKVLRSQAKPDWDKIADAIRALMSPRFDDGVLAYRFRGRLGETMERLRRRYEGNRAILFWNQKRRGGTHAYAAALNFHLMDLERRLRAMAKKQATVVYERSLPDRGTTGPAPWAYHLRSDAQHDEDNRRRVESEARHHLKEHMQ